MDHCDEDYTAEKARLFVVRLRVRAFAEALTGDQDTALRLFLMAQNAEGGS